jgi:hypothetical protein
MQQLLSSNLFALEECASLQPNSRSWHNENACAPQGGLLAFLMGTLLDATMRDARGGLRPVDGTTMRQARKGNGMAGTGGMGLAMADTPAGVRMSQFPDATGMMRHEARPDAAQIQISDYTISNFGPTGTFKKINTGSHSRLGGLPPLTKASAPPGRASADPGGGTTAS